MRVSESVRAVQVPDENPMHPDFTNIYIVGGAHVLSIDSGEAIDRYRWMLRGYLAATERAEIAMAGITHHHSDHSGNLKWVREVLDADVVVPKKAIPLLRGRLPKERVEILDLDRPITLEGGPRVQVLATPGHSVDSVCYYVEEEGVLFTGDTLLGSSTTTVHDLRDYRRTLQHLLGLPNLRVICPGHGPLVHDPRERLQSYVDHRNMRERQILQVIEKKGAVTSWEIMMELYPEIDKRLRRAADNNVRSHLVQLEHEGRLKVYPGKPGKPDVKKRQKDVEHAKYRRDIIKKAQKFEAEDRRAEIRAQENPPTAEWRQPPRYELIGTARE
jgi:glyoxylase-like metal-dependent hydrolase (beta-lactamase superfamily II)